MENLLCSLLFYTRDKLNRFGIDTIDILLLMLAIEISISIYFSMLFQGKLIL